MANLQIVDQVVNEQVRGFGSLDYAAFGRPAVDAPLTDEAERDRLLGNDGGRDGRSSLAP